MTAPFDHATTAAVNTPAAAAMTVELPPEPPDNTWAIAVAAILLALAAAAAAVVAGIRRARARRWQPAASDRVRPITLLTQSAAKFTADSLANPDQIPAVPIQNSERAQQLDAESWQCTN
jgi:hypothetical protein